MSTDFHPDAKLITDGVTIGDIRTAFDMANVPDDTPVSVFFMRDLNDTAIEYPIEAAGLETQTNKFALVIMPQRA